MYQNLVLSPLFLEGLKDISDQKYNRVLGGLLTERILCDSEKILLEEYDKLLIELDKNGSITPIKKAIITALTSNGIVKIISDIKVKRRIELDYDKYESEKKLTERDEWKIILTKQTSNELKLKFQLESGIEIAGVSEYLNPFKNSRIMSEETIIKVPGDEFDFRKWICKYLKNSKSLTIKDDYICTKNSKEDFEYIIGKVNKNIPISVITLSDEARNKSFHNDTLKDDGIRVVQILEELKNKHSLSKFLYETIGDKKILTDRSLDTDLWHINLGHAFGSVKGNTVTRQFEINVQLQANINKENLKN